jgi:adenylylsulfate kinase
MTSGVVVWMTGLPSSGKSTLAEALASELRVRGVSVCLLDGDRVRASLVPEPGYSPEGRANFYETLARLAALAAEQGLVVIVAATAHRRVFRERARQLAPAFIEVWVDTPLAECAKRDAKGLYAASASGQPSGGLPGVDEEYEKPEAPEVVAHGGQDLYALSELMARI